MRALGFAHVFRGKQPSVIDLVSDKKWTDGGLLILSKARFRILDEDDMIFPLGSNLDQGASKGALFVRLKIADVCLMVFNCHLQANHGGYKGWRFYLTLPRSRVKFFEIRQTQLQELRRFIAKKTHAYPDDPWILGNKYLSGFVDLWFRRGFQY